MMRSRCSISRPDSGHYSMTEVAGLAQLASLMDVAELEQLVILAENDQGLTPEGMSRPLHPHEQGTDWQAIDAMFTAAYTASGKIVDSLHNTVVASLQAAMSGAVTAGEALTVLVGWSQSQPRIVRAAVAKAATGLSGVLAQVYGRAGGILAADAAKQGVGGAAPVAVEAGRFLPLATPAALWLPTRLATYITTTGGPQLTGPDDLLGLAEAMPTDGGLDLARQATHIAAGQGRLDAVTQISDGRKFTAYASELLDGQTCGPCSHVDGTQYDTLAEALTDYPGMGPYKNCAGGDRCRGTVVITWESEAPPSVN